MMRGRRGVGWRSRSGVVRDLRVAGRSVHLDVDTTRVQQAIAGGGEG